LYVKKSNARIKSYAMKYTLIEFILLTIMGTGLIFLGIMAFIYGFKRRREPYDPKHAHSDPRWSMPSGIFSIIAGAVILYGLISNALKSAD
jgi:uncharacterized membrane protein HdeD (DUF308 family)